MEAGVAAASWACFLKGILHRVTQPAWRCVTEGLGLKPTPRPIIWASRNVCHDI